MSYRVRILLLGALVALPLLLLAVAGATYNLRERERSLNDERVAVARSTASAVEAFLAGDIAALQSIAAMTAIRNLESSSSDDIESAMTPMFASFENLDTIGLIGLDGWNIRSMTRHVPVPPRSINISDRQYFRDVVTTGNVTISPAVISRVRTDVPVVAIGVPIYAPGDGSDQEVVGVLVGTLSLARLQDFAITTLAKPGADIVLVDSDGQVMIASYIDPESQRELVSYRGRPDVDAVLAGESGSQQVHVNGETLLVNYAAVPMAGWGVLIEEPVDQAFADVRSETLRSIGLLILALTFSFTVAWVLSSRLVQSVKDLEIARNTSERSRQRLSFLVRSSRQLAATLDYESTLDTVSRMAVPGFADWCAVDIVEPGRDGAQRLSIAHGNPAFERLAGLLQEQFPVDLTGESGAAHVIRSGEALLIDRVTDEMLRAEAVDDEHLSLLRQIAPQSVIIVPLRGPVGVIGAMTFVTTEPEHRYTTEDLRLALDLADRAAMAVENARLFAEVHDAVRTRDEFLSSASHDLKNPLSTIKLRVQLLQRRAASNDGVDTDAVIQAAGQIDAIVTRATALVDDLSDITRLQLGQPLELVRQPVDLVAIIRDAVTDVQATTNRHHVHVDVPADAVVGEWDGRRLRRVIENLLSNAVKYSPSGGEIVIGLTKEASPSDSVTLTVRDQGIGIPVDDIPRLFERFRRGSNVIGRIGGTGIGLASARQIVESHGGSIALDSTEGVGTVVTVWLPLTPTSESPTP